jgi:hypothetical protein
MNRDFLDLLRAFVVAEVRFLVVGAYALGLHGRPRATGDLDVWIDATPDNASRVMRALQTFGAPMADITEADFIRNNVKRAGSGIRPTSRVWSSRLPAPSLPGSSRGDSA